MPAWNGGTGGGNGNKAGLRLSWHEPGRKYAGLSGVRKFFREGLGCRDGLRIECLNLGFRTGRSIETIQLHSIMLMVTGRIVWLGIKMGMQQRCKALQ